MDLEDKSMKFTNMVFVCLLVRFQFVNVYCCFRTHFDEDEKDVVVQREADPHLRVAGVRDHEVNADNLAGDKVPVVESALLDMSEYVVTFVPTHCLLTALQQAKHLQLVLIFGDVIVPIL